MQLQACRVRTTWLPRGTLVVYAFEFGCPVF